MTQKTKHVIFNSEGFSVRLTDNEYKLFKEEERRLHLRWMKIEKQARGIWASNQGKYVQSVEELIPLDIRPDPEVLK